MKQVKFTQEELHILRLLLTEKKSNVIDLRNGKTISLESASRTIEILNDIHAKIGYRN